MTPGTQAHVAPLPSQIEVDLCQIGSKRMLNGAELGRVGQVTARSPAGHDAEQANQRRQRDNAFLGE